MLQLLKLLKCRAGDHLKVFVLASATEGAQTRADQLVECELD
jgi:hypothetical protein